MKVFRIEDGSGNGMYRYDCNLAPYVSERLQNPHRHPTPDFDKRLAQSFSRLGVQRYYSPEGEWKFGFSSIWQLQKWLQDEDLEALEALGGVVVVVDAPPDCIAQGETQCAFKAGSARIEEVVPPTCFKRGREDRWH